MSEHSSVLITGAAGTIGGAAAALLSARGYPVILVDRDAAAVATLAATLPGASWVQGDALEAASMAAIFEDAAPVLGSVVLAVGGEGPLGMLEDCPDEAFEQTMRLNVTSVWLGLKHALKALKPKGSGSIVAVSSISGVVAAPMMSAIEELTGFLTRESVASQTGWRNGLPDEPRAHPMGSNCCCTLPTVSTPLSMAVHLQDLPICRGGDG